jgi:lipopolysaccharide export system permease protein
VKKLHSFILKSYIGPFILTFFVAQFFLLMQFLWKYIDDLIGKGLDFSVILELLFYASSSLVPLSLPLAILLSSIMTFGNLAENNELMALKSAGISLYHIMLPLIIFIFFLGVGAFFFSNDVMPYTNLKMGALLYDVRKQQPEISIKEGIFSDAIEGYVIKVAKKSKTSSMLYSLMIYDHTNNKGNTKVTIADSALMKLTEDDKYMVLTMYHGTTYDEIDEKKKRIEKREYPHQVTTFDKQRVLIDLSGLGFKRTNEDLFKNHYQMLNINQLAVTIDSLSRRFENKEKEFVSLLEKRSYFKRLRLVTVDSNWYDKDVLPKKVLSVDSIFANFSENDKILVFEQAKNYVRSTQTFISSSAKELHGKMNYIKRHEIEWHRKFTLSLACLLLFFIGAPLGAIIRKGGFGTPVVISVIFFVIYYVLTMTGEKSAKMGEWESWQGMWMSAFILAPLGIFLTYKATADAIVLDFTFWSRIKNFFGKLIGRIKNKKQ